MPMKYQMSIFINNDTELPTRSQYRFISYQNLKINHAPTMPKQKTYDE